MPTNEPRVRIGRWIGGAAALAALAALAPHAAAHFVLEVPASWRVQDAFGSPQKLGPCGDDGSAATTGAVTAFQTGQTITITLHEIIFHPGHYRVALAVHDRSELPAEPVVTAGSTACGSVPIQSPPVFPVLADGVLAHTSAFSGPQSITVTLPAGVTCDHCTLQVIEFMSQHSLNNPGGCFYHHCADISIHDVVVGMDAGTSAGMDAGTSAGMDAGVSTPAARAACGCSLPGRDPNRSWPGLVIAPFVALAVRRRRR